MMAWIWGTPIMYSLDNLSTFIQRILMINPMTLIVMSYHDVLYYKEFPSLVIMLIVLIEALVLLVVGEVVFDHLSGDFAEEL